MAKRRPAGGQLAPLLLAALPQLARTTPSLTITGSCAPQAAVVDGQYHLRGSLSSGAPVYVRWADDIFAVMYYDTACSSQASGMWFLTSWSGEELQAALAGSNAADVDGDGSCIGRAGLTTSSTLPMNSRTWRMYCGDAEGVVDTVLQISEASVTNVAGFMIQAEASCLTIGSSGFVDSSAGDCNASDPSQQWHWHEDWQEERLIRNVHGSCLTLDSGLRLSAKPCNSYNPNQYWYFEGDGTSSRGVLRWGLGITWCIRSSEVRMGPPCTRYELVNNSQAEELWTTTTVTTTTVTATTETTTTTTASTLTSVTGTTITSTTSTTAGTFLFKQSGSELCLQVFSADNFDDGIMRWRLQTATCNNNPWQNFILKAGSSHIHHVYGGCLDIYSYDEGRQAHVVLGNCTEVSAQRWYGLLEGHLCNEENWCLYIGPDDVSGSLHNETHFEVVRSNESTHFWPTTTTISTTVTKRTDSCTENYCSPNNGRCTEEYALSDCTDCGLCLCPDGQVFASELQECVSHFWMIYRSNVGAMSSHHEDMKCERHPRCKAEVERLEQSPLEADQRIAAELGKIGCCPMQARNSLDVLGIPSDFHGYGWARMLECCEVVSSGAGSRYVEWFFLTVTVEFADVLVAYNLANVLAALVFLGLWIAHGQESSRQQESEVPLHTRYASVASAVLCNRARLLRALSAVLFFPGWCATQLLAYQEDSKSKIMLGVKCCCFTGLGTMTALIFLPHLQQLREIDEESHVERLPGHILLCLLFVSTLALLIGGKRAFQFGQVMWASTLAGTAGHLIFFSATAIFSAAVIVLAVTLTLAPLLRTAHFGSSWKVPFEAEFQTCKDKSQGASGAVEDAAAAACQCLKAVWTGLLQFMLSFARVLLDLLLLRELLRIMNEFFAAMTLGFPEELLHHLARLIPEIRVELALVIRIPLVTDILIWFWDAGLAAIALLSRTFAPAATCASTSVAGSILGTLLMHLVVLWAVMADLPGMLQASIVRAQHGSPAVQLAGHLLSLADKAFNKGLQIAALTAGSNAVQSIHNLHIVAEWELFLTNTVCGGGSFFDNFVKFVLDFERPCFAIGVTALIFVLVNGHLMAEKEVMEPLAVAAAANWERLSAVDDDNQAFRWGTVTVTLRGLADVEECDFFKYFVFQGRKLVFLPKHQHLRDLPKGGEAPSLASDDPFKVKSGERVTWLVVKAGTEGSSVDLKESTGEKLLEEIKGRWVQNKAAFELEVVALQVPYFAVLPTLVGMWVPQLNVKAYKLEERAQAYLKAVGEGGEGEPEPELTMELMQRLKLTTATLNIVMLMGVPVLGFFAKAAEYLGGEAAIRAGRASQGNIPCTTDWSPCFCTTRHQVTGTKASLLDIDAKLRMVRRPLGDRTGFAILSNVEIEGPMGGAVPPFCVLVGVRVRAAAESSATMRLWLHTDREFRGTFPGPTLRQRLLARLPKFLGGRELPQQPKIEMTEPCHLDAVMKSLDSLGDSDEVELTFTTSPWLAVDPKKISSLLYGWLVLLLALGMLLNFMPVSGALRGIVGACAVRGAIVALGLDTILEDAADAADELEQQKDHVEAVSCAAHGVAKGLEEAVEGADDLEQQKDGTEAISVGTSGIEKSLEDVTEGARDLET